MKEKPKHEVKFESRFRIICRLTGNNTTVLANELPNRLELNERVEFYGDVVDLTHKVSIQGTYTVSGIKHIFNYINNKMTLQITEYTLKPVVKG